MMAIQWNETYTTGVKDVDNQHKQLFDLINALGGQSLQTGSRPLVEKALGFLETYVKSHFSFEEACMNRYKCPFAAKNKDEHEKFIGAFNGFKARFVKEGPTPALLKEIQQAAEKWIVSHICRVDATLKPYATP